MDDLISRAYILAEYDRQHKGPPGGARKIIETAPAVDAVPVAAREMQRQMGEFAVKAMDLPLSERDMSGVTMGITRGVYEQIKKEIADFRRRIVAIASADDDTEQVYRLNLQLFPLSERLEKKREIEKEREEQNEK